MVISCGFHLQISVYDGAVDGCHGNNPKVAAVAQWKGSDSCRTCLSSAGDTHWYMCHPQLPSEWTSESLGAGTGESQLQVRVPPAF